MDLPVGFTIEQGRAFFRPSGSVTFDEAVALVLGAIEAACANQVRSLLVDSTALTGFRSPDTFQRFLAAVAWAEEASGRLRLSMVARPAMIDPNKFGVTVATNRGLECNIFTTEVEALAWLAATETRGSG
jgi:hypothetical protein